MNKYSYSSIQTYIDCPQKYWFNYKLGLNFTKTSYALLLGTTVHKCIETFFDTDKKLKKQEIENMFESEFEGIVMASELDEPIKKKSENLALGKKLIEQFYNSSDMTKLKPIIWKDYSGDEKKTLEVYFRLPLIDLQTGEIIFDGEISGQIDFIGEESKRNSDNLIRVRDHKTLKYKFSDWVVENPVQLWFYSYAFRYMAIEGRFPYVSKKEEDTVGYNILDKTKAGVPSVLDKKVTNEDLQVFYNIVKKIDRAISSDIFYPVLKDDVCYKFFRPCEFMELCHLKNKNVRPFKDGEIDMDWILEKYKGEIYVREDKKENRKT